MAMCIWEKGISTDVNTILWSLGFAKKGICQNHWNASFLFCIFEWQLIHVCTLCWIQNSLFFFCSCCSRSTDQKLDNFRVKNVPRIVSNKHISTDHITINKRKQHFPCMCKHRITNQKKYVWIKRSNNIKAILHHL